MTGLGQHGAMAWPMPVVAPVTSTVLAWGEGGGHGEKRGQAIPIAPLRPPTLAAFRPWGIEVSGRGRLALRGKGRTGTPGCIFAPTVVFHYSPPFQFPGPPCSLHGAGAALVMVGYFMAFWPLRVAFGAWSTPFVLMVVVSVMVMVLLTVVGEGATSFGRAFGLSLLAGWLARIGYNVFNLLYFGLLHGHAGDYANCWRTSPRRHFPCSASMPMRRTADMAGCFGGRPCGR